MSIERAIVFCISCCRYCNREEALMLGINVHENLNTLEIFICKDCYTAIDATTEEKISYLHIVREDY